MVPSSVLSAALAAPTVVEIHDGNALADQLVAREVELDAHPVPHPGCMRCDKAIVASRRAQMGLPTRPRGAPNRVRIVDMGDAGLLVVPEGAP